MYRALLAPADISLECRDIATVSRLVTSRIHGDASATKRVEQRSLGSFVLSVVAERDGDGNGGGSGGGVSVGVSVGGEQKRARGRRSRERGREDLLRRPQLKRGLDRERVQLPTGNGIPLFPGTMIRYVAV